MMKPSESWDLPTVDELVLCPHLRDCLEVGERSPSNKEHNFSLERAS